MAKLLPRDEMFGPAVTEWTKGQMVVGAVIGLTTIDDSGTYRIWTAWDDQAPLVTNYGLCTVLSEDARRMMAPAEEPEEDA